DPHAPTAPMATQAAPGGPGNAHTAPVSGPGLADARAPDAPGADRSDGAEGTGAEGTGAEGANAGATQTSRRRDGDAPAADPAGRSADATGTRTEDRPGPGHATAPASAPPRGAKPTGPPPDTAESPGAPPLRVLSAEDNRTNRLVFARMIADMGCELAFATNGREAVEIFSSFRPALVFMDISMPEMDGREATRRIRTLPGGAEVPIIALTAHAMSGDAEELLARGFTDYMTKPLRKQALRDMLDRHAAPGARRAR
ncbi:MAG: response regulator, partial [Rhodobacteraceae bacterium]|nr:response regulator [Paracoccaceae bacterium]